MKNDNLFTEEEQNKFDSHMINNSIYNTKDYYDRFYNKMYITSLKNIVNSETNIF